jgi:hypothetical protein
MDSFVQLIESIDAQVTAHPQFNYLAVLGRLLGILETAEIEDARDRIVYRQQLLPLLRSITARASPRIAEIAKIYSTFASPATRLLLSQYGAALTAAVSVTHPLEVLHFSAIFNVNLTLVSDSVPAQQMREHIRRHAKASAHTILNALGTCAEIDDFIKYGVDVHKGDRLALIVLISTADCLRRGISLVATSAAVTPVADELDTKHSGDTDSDPTPKRRRILSNARAAGKRARISDSSDDNYDSDDTHAPPPRRTHPDLSEAEHKKLAAWLNEFYAKDLQYVCKRLGIDIGYVKDDHIDSIIEELGYGIYTHPELEWRRCRH